MVRPGGESGQIIMGVFVDPRNVTPAKNQGGIVALCNFLSALLGVCIFTKEKPTAEFEERTVYQSPYSLILFGYQFHFKCRWIK